MLKFPFLVRLLLLSLLTACSGLGDDNAPAPAALTSYSFQFQPQRLWSVQTGAAMDADVLRLGPTIKAGRVFVGNQSGLLTAVTLNKGEKLWQVRLDYPISTRPAVSQGMVVLASVQPQLIALSATNGHLLWRAPLPNQVLAPPNICRDRVVLKTIDGQVLAFALRSGRLLWTYKHGAPILVSRVGSMPQIAGNRVLLGFSDGVFAALSLKDGHLLWERTLASPQGITQADQLVDIAADPVLDEQTVYVATYQGNLVAMALQTGQIRWQRPFSSYSGLALGENLYATDSEGVLWCFDRLTGRICWRNDLLKNRGLTAPVAMGRGSLVLGDREGYLHWFSQTDGRPLARVLVGKAGMVTVPRVVYPLVCVLTQSGSLSVWTV